MRSHKTQEEHVNSGREPAWWIGNNQADQRATLGISLHQDCEASSRVYKERREFCFHLQDYLVGQQTRVTNQSKKWAALEPHKKVPRNLDLRKEQPLRQAKANQHEVREIKGSQVCLKCGRRTKGESKKQSAAKL